MAGRALTFAFVMVRTAPQEAEPFDAVWRYTVPYMRFRHPDVHARHWVLCVGDALAIMNAAAATGDTLAEVHVYAHANELGSVWGRLQSAKEAYRALVLDDIVRFRRADARAAAVAKKADRNTRLCFHGCNLGKSPAALIAWRDAFGVTRGSGSAPDLFQHFCAGTLEMRATCPGSTVPFIERSVASMADVERYIADAIAAAPDRCGNLRADFAAQFRKRALADVDARLLARFKKMRGGSEMPWSDAPALTDEAATKRMRTLFEQASGIPFTFLARQLLSLPVLGNACDEGKLRASADLGAVFPWDLASWKGHHHWEPRAPPERTP